MFNELFDLMVGWEFICLIGWVGKFLGFVFYYWVGYKVGGFVVLGLGWCDFVILFSGEISDKVMRM